MSHPPVDLEQIEKAMRLIRGRDFTGWHQGEFFFEGIAAKRIAAWIWRDIRNKSQEAGT